RLCVREGDRQALLSAAPTAGLASARYRPFRPRQRLADLPPAVAPPGAKIAATTVHPLADARGYLLAAWRLVAERRDQRGRPGRAEIDPHDHVRLDGLRVANRRLRRIGLHHPIFQVA